MKIALINGSPKPKNNASGIILNGLQGYLNNNDVILNFHIRKSILNKAEVKKISECDTLVFAFPLYVDGIPSHLLNLLIELEKIFNELDSHKKTVYVIVNCGFYEGRQCSLAIKMMRNWCTRSKIKWGQGIGVGAGGMLESVKNVPMGYGPNTNLGKALKNLAGYISASSYAKTIFITENFPRFAYKIAAEYGWKVRAKKNGLKLKDLNKQY